MSFLRSFHIIVSVSVLTLLLYEVSGVKAFHPINVRKLYDFGFGERFKKDSIHPPTLSNDMDVIELEKLKNPENSELPSLLNNDDILPALEKQLESSTISSVPTMMVATTTTLSESIPKTVAISNNNNNSSSIINQGQPEKEEHVVVQHKPPTLTNMHNTPVATNHEQQKIQQQQQSDEVTKYSSSIEKSHPLKPFYGAARLAFGQNPEVIPLSSSSTAPTITTAASQSSTDNSLVNSNDDEHMNAESSNNDQDQNNNNNNQNNDNDNDKNSESSVSAELEATKNGERRSVNTIISPKIAESLLNHRDGHYSSFDMAQYVFWTGDEAGVAKAVEEFIQQGLMSRENAIKFLRDIRLGIEYLQNSYANRIYPDYIKGNNYVFPPSSSSSILSAQKSIITTKEPLTSPTPTTTTTTSSTSTTTAKPTITKNNNINNPTIQKSLIESENLILTENLQKAFEGIPSLLRLQEINNARKTENSIEYGDEIAARMRLTDFLYAEYSLEEVIYQLAKVMFSQSLTHGSEQSQKALRRLTEFLENEGEHGRISPALQKKVLDVLLAALSDTLAEHPELLESAKIGLGNSFHKLPKSSSLLNP